jgi:transcriptional regulator with XRE-family HTH domain
MTHNTLAMSIRAKKLAVLMRAARQKAGKSTSECADLLGISPEEYESFELGETSPSLPQTELLAFSLNIPLEHFYGDGLVGDSNQPGQQYKPEQLVLLRQRIIGVMLKKARLQAGLDLESVADEMGVEVGLLEAYEMGEKPIPVPYLEACAHFYGQSLKDFQDKHGPVGQWIKQQAVVREVLELPPELQAFVCLPVNRPYIELAKRLSEMSVEKLRAVAEGLLEITL